MSNWMTGWWVGCCGEVFGDQDEAGVWWWCSRYECGDFGPWQEHEWLAGADLRAHHEACGYWHEPNVDVED